MENQVIRTEDLQIMEARQQAELATTPVGKMMAQIQMCEKVGMMYSKSTLIPDAFRNNPTNCAIAVEMAVRLNMNPVMVMQNMYIVKEGHPSFSSQFIIALINNSGEFEPLRWEARVEDNAIRAYTYRKSDTEHEFRLEGSWITPKMVIDAGWGPNWKKIPEQMYKYRAAMFWMRLHAPQIGMGYYSTEEVVEPSFVTDTETEETSSETQTMTKAQKSIEAKKRRQAEESAKQQTETNSNEVVESEAPILELKTETPEPVKKSVREMAMESHSHYKQEHPDTNAE